MSAEQWMIEPGDRVIVTTNDGHRFAGRLVEVRSRSDTAPTAVVKLDSGWLTSYPLPMLRPEADLTK